MKMRKIALIGIALILICMVPPVMFLYSDAVLVFGLPLFFVVFELLALCIPILLLLCYREQYGRKED